MLLQSRKIIGMICLAMLLGATLLQASDRPRIEPPAVTVDLPQSPGLLTSPALESQVPLFKVYSNWDEDWQPHSRYEYVYDTSDNVHSETTLLWDDPDWVKSERTTYTYNGSSSFIEAVHERWDGAKWINDWRSVYDPGGTSSSEELLEQVWINNDWVNETKIVYEREAGEITTSTMYEWTLGGWTEVAKMLYTYDGFGNVTEHISQEWTGSDWENFMRLEYTYDVDGLMKLYLVQYWSGTDWQDEIRYRYSYRPDSQLSIMVQEVPDGGYWPVVGQTTYSYNDSDLQIEYLVQKWVGGHWLNNYRQLFTYDGFDRITLETYQVWTEIPPSGAWENKTQWEYGYDSPTSVDGTQAIVTLPVISELSQNLPNPFNPRTEIAFELTRRTHVRLAIFNLLGQEVSTLADGELAAGQHNLVWNAEGFASGVYFYRLETDSEVLVRKMTLLK